MKDSDIKEITEDRNPIVNEFQQFISESIFEFRAKRYYAEIEREVATGRRASLLMLVYAITAATALLIGILFYLSGLYSFTNWMATGSLIGAVIGTIVSSAIIGLAMWSYPEQVSEDLGIFEVTLTSDPNKMVEQIESMNNAVRLLRFRQREIRVANIRRSRIITVSLIIYVLSCSLMLFVFFNFVG